MIIFESFDPDMILSLKESIDLIARVCAFLHVVLTILKGDGRSAVFLTLTFITDLALRAEVSSC